MRKYEGDRNRWQAKASINRNPNQVSQFKYSPIRSQNNWHRRCNLAPEINLFLKNLFKKTLGEIKFKRVLIQLSWYSQTVRICFSHVSQYPKLSETDFSDNNSVWEICKHLQHHPPTKYSLTFSRNIFQIFKEINFNFSINMLKLFRHNSVWKICKHLQHHQTAKKYIERRISQFWRKIRSRRNSWIKSKAMFPYFDQNTFFMIEAKLINFRLEQIWVCLPARVCLPVLVCLPV